MTEAKGFRTIPTTFSLLAQLAPGPLRNGVKRLAAATTAARYRQLAQTSPLAAGRQRIYHYHIRKTAGTSLNLAFLSQGGEDGASVYQRLRRGLHGRAVSGGRVFVGFNRPLIQQGYYHYAFSHLPFEKVALRPGTFTLTCMRDPVQRVCSLWKMFRDRTKAGPFRRLIDREARWAGHGVMDFLDRAPRREILNQLYIFSTEFNVNEALERIAGLDCVLFVDTFAQSVTELNQRLGVSLPVLQTNRTSAEALAPEANARLREELAPEYDLMARLGEELGS